MMAQNYTELTSHAPRRKNVPRVSPGPTVGQLIKCDIALIRQDDTSDGTSTTPMTKIRYNFALNEWRQVRPTEAGMFVFFNNEPETLHTEFRITSIIPSKTGCYADLL